MDFSSFSSVVDKILLAVLSVLPDSPFTMLQQSPEIYNVLRYVNWFIPVSSMIAIGETWLVAFSVYFVWSLVLRWAKAIE